MESKEKKKKTPEPVLTAAEDHRSFLASIVESSDDAIISKDLDGTIRSWNRGAEAIYGYEAEEVMGRSARFLAPPGQPDEVAAILEQVSGALAAAHRQGIVHRDLKPENLMLDRVGNVKVMDFGIARAVSDAQATMTQTAQVIGTAQYLSPEQARGERVDSRSDLYSVGCLLYELLTGRPPFMGDSPVAIAYQHVREAPVPPSRMHRPPGAGAQPAGRRPARAAAAAAGRARRGRPSSTTP